MAKSCFLCPSCGFEDTMPGTCPECSLELEEICKKCGNTLDECVCDSEPEDQA